jgi:transcriptional regulator with XRE-family HTH domain
MAEPWFFEVLPCRPVPYPDECLSGYVLRLAEANGFLQLWDLATDLFPRWSHPDQVTRLRWEYPVEDWRRLLQRIQLPASVAQGMTLVPLVAKFRPSPDLARSSYLSPGQLLRGVLKPDLQVCPLCLQAAPYLRLSWRLASLTICPEHRCLLQTQCQSCNTVLTIASPILRHLRCAGCGTDLRTLPVVPVPAPVLAAQQARQTGLRYLLDPERRLVPELPPGSPKLPAAVGLKFRYLRLQAERSVADMARRMGIFDGTLSALELGQSTPLTYSLAYLDQFELSWSEFAALRVPPGFLEELSAPRYLALRRCPRAGCPNHRRPQLPPRVTLLADLPDRRIARFRCHACGHTFTRSYDGQRVTKPRKPVIRPGDPPTVPKPPREITRLKAMGLRGEDNRQIAHTLGWGEKTVRMYWIALGLEDRVHQAQARRRTRERQQRQAARRSQVEAALRTMRQQNQEITLSRVGVAAGHGPNFLNSYPDLARRVKAVAGPHNARVRQQRYVAVRACLTEAIAQMQQSDTFVKVEALVHPTGLTYTQLQGSYPDLFELARQAARSHREAVRVARCQARQAAINAAAARLVARGSRLTYRTIVTEAKLSPPTAQGDPTLRDLLYQWVGDFAPHD